MNANIRRWLAEPSGLDPDAARRRRLLNILLLGTLLCAGLGLAVTLLVDILGLYPGEQYGVLYLAIGGTLVLIVALLVVNHIWQQVRLAGIVYLGLLLLLAAGVDTPREVIQGRSLIWFVLPILTASFLLRPAAGFAAAGLSVVLCGGIGLAVGLPPNLYALLVFFAVALIAWLASRGLERAVVESRQQAHIADVGRADLQRMAAQLQETVAHQAGLLAIVQELEVPVLPLLPGLIVLPLVGGVDALRAQKVSQTLLQSIYDHRAQVVIVDLTGFRLTDDSAVSYLSEAARGAQLLGAQVIFSGIGGELALALVSQEIRLPGETAHDLQSALRLVQKTPPGSK